MKYRGYVSFPFVVGVLALILFSLRFCVFSSGFFLFSTLFRVDYFNLPTPADAKTAKEVRKNYNNKNNTRVKENHSLGAFFSLIFIRSVV